MALQRQRRARMHDDPLDLETVGKDQRLEPAPGAMIAREGLGLARALGLQRATASFTSCARDLSATSTASGIATAIMSCSPMPTSCWSRRFRPQQAVVQSMVVAAHG
jgi:hypothetical protein